MKYASDLIKRSISGLLFVILVTSSIFLGSACFAALFLVVNIYACLEFRRMLLHLNIRLCTHTLLLSSSLLFISGYLHTQYDIQWGYVLTFISTFSISLVELFRKKLHAVQNVGLAFFALCYITIPFTMLLYFPGIQNGWQPGWKPYMVFIPFFVVWLNDTFAYLCGITFGKHKFFPRISPKKTWEGAIGGAVVAIVGGTLFTSFVEPGNLVDSVIISILVVVFGTLGDLFESMIKRTIEIKDSGRIMPGHGGILDRMDSLLFAIPAVFIYMVIVFLLI